MKPMRHETRVVASVALLFAWSALPTAAQTLEESAAAYEGGDYATALQGFRLAAEQGNALAQFALGFMYYNGQGVVQDYAEAVRWNRLAAEQGDASAQFSLGLRYDYGEGVPQDFVRAHKWYNLAASRESDAETRAVMVKARNRVAGKLTAEDLAEAQRLARQWQPQVDTDR